MLLDVATAGALLASGGSGSGASDTATLVIAVLGLALSVFAVGWQIAGHLLSGSRPKASAIVAKVNDRAYAHWPMRDGGRWIKRGAKIQPGQTTMPGDLQLGVLVHNRGRTPIDVTGVQLRFESGQGYGEFGGRGPSNRLFNPERPHTLNAGQQAMWTFDLEGVADFVRRARDQLTVRGGGSLLFGRAAGSPRHILGRMVVDVGTGREICSQWISFNNLL